MTSIRNLGGVPLANIQANAVEFYTFIRADFSSPVGTKRWTDRATGFTGNIDGTSQTWTEYLFNVGALHQGNQEVAAVSWLEFANLDNAWIGYASSPGIRNTPIAVYVGWFDSSGTLLGTYKLYDGRADECQLSKTARVVLKPHITPWTKEVPSAVVGPTCVHIYKDAASCQYAGAEPGGETTCFKSRANCAARGNLAHFGGFDLLPIPGVVLHWASAPGPSSPQNPNWFAAGWTGGPTTAPPSGGPNLSLPSLPGVPATGRPRGARRP